jgi:ketosteroid isomerase-like protein
MFVDVDQLSVYQSFSTEFFMELPHPIIRSSVSQISVPFQLAEVSTVINKCFVFLLWSIFLALPVFAAQHVAVHPRPPFESTDQATIREIIDMERQAREASLHRDADFSQKTLAEDYVAITPLGQVTTKQDTVSARKSGQLRYDTLTVSDMVVRVYGDTAVVTARADVKGHQLGEDFSGPYRYTRVWVRRTGHWQAVSYQATVTQ